VVVRSPSGEDATMDPLLAWMVDLTAGSVHDDIEGVLHLTDDGLAFEPGEGETVRIAYERIAHIKRLRMSPVLMVRWEDLGVRTETAFYLAKPPPLGGSSGGRRLLYRDAMLGASTGQDRPGKVTRTQRRRNTYYLSSASTDAKPVLVAWVRAVRERMEAGAT
jgi:hypothetical protein